MQGCNEHTTGVRKVKESHVAQTRHQTKMAKPTTFLEAKAFISGYCVEDRIFLFIRHLLLKQNVTPKYLNEVLNT
jgi:hypothetical protein